MVIIDCSYNNINQTEIIRLTEYILKIYGMERCEVSISFVSDVEIQNLNRQYRNIDRPTDVLSFALAEGEEMPDDTMLGDIVISYDTAEKQAKEFNHPLEIEINHLICHSMLHLFGFDHIKEEDRKEMFSEHRQILKDYYTEENKTDYIEDYWFLEPEK
ncbi:MAG: rRNA maturation RNase YbeY [Armatimonadetes bacterium]|nr:rRNA maturation RNase YbeY [Candidatus Hippobium faecium]